LSGTAFGTVVLHISPEAAAGGPLAHVRDGDMIKLDTKNRRLDFKVSDAELAKRKAEWKPLPKPDRGYLKLYTQTVTQAEHGCDFDFLSGIKS
jgi:dihydroxy-acid dehydratase